MIINVGNAIKQNRTRCKMTQVQLAQKLNMTWTYMSTLEHNRKSPPMKTMHKLAKIFGMSLPEFWADCMQGDNQAGDNHKWK